MFDKLYSNVVNFEVDCAASGNNTIYNVTNGQRVLVLDLFLQAEADVTIQVRSAATDLTGPIDFTTATARERRFSNGGIPVFKTVATGDDLILNLSGAVQVNGYGVAVEVRV